MTDEPTRGRGREPVAEAESRWWTGLLHLLAVCGLAVAQPLYEAMNRHPEFGIAHGLTAGDRISIAVVLSLVVALLLWLPTAGLSLVRRSWGRHARTLLVGGVLASLALALMPGDTASTGMRLAVLVAATLVCSWVYRRSAAVRRLLTVLAIGALVFPVLFLWRGERAEGPQRPIGAQVPPVTAAELTGEVPPIVLVVLDELPLASLLAGADTIDDVRFPRLAALSRRSHWFLRATTVAQSTSAAVPAILTGRLPRGKVPPTAVGHPDTLFTRLREVYAFNVSEASTDLCGPVCTPDEPADGAQPRETRAREARSPETRASRLRLALEDLGAIFLAARLPALAPPIDAGWAGFWRAAPVLVRDASPSAWQARQPARRFEDFLARLRAAPRRTFHYLHLMLPHVPWQYLPDGRLYPRERGTRVHGLTPGGSWRPDVWQVTQAQQRHLLQLSFADRLVGRLIDALEEEGLFDRSLLVVTADHGTSFRPGDKRRVLTQGNLPEIVHVPLFVKLPRQRGGSRHEAPAQLVDLAPTVAELLGFDMGPGIDGRDLFGEAPAPERGVVYRSWYHGGAGRPLAFDWSRLEEAEAAAAVRERFPADSLYEVGPHRELLGREVSALPAGAGAGVVELSLPHLPAIIDPAAPTLPVHLMGTVTFPRETAKHEPLALAIDGIICAVTRTYGSLPASRLDFSVLFDPQCLRAGVLRPEFFRVADGGTLAPLELEPGAAPEP